LQAINYSLILTVAWFLTAYPSHSLFYIVGYTLFLLSPVDTVVDRSSLLNSSHRLTTITPTSSCVEATLDHSTTVEILYTSGNRGISYVMCMCMQLCNLFYKYYYSCAVFFCVLNPFIFVVCIYCQFGYVL